MFLFLFVLKPFYNNNANSGLMGAHCTFVTETLTHRCKKPILNDKDTTYFLIFSQSTGTLFPRSTCFKIFQTFFKPFLACFSEISLYLQTKNTIKQTTITMKRIATLLVALLAITSLHAEEQPITFGELPKNAKIFVLTYFKDIKFKEVYIERRASLTQYEVKLEGGIDLQFDRMGLCTEITCKNGEIPDIVIPKRILTTIQKNFPDSYIRKYENNGRMYEIVLDDGTQLTFSRTLRLVDIED